MVLIRRFPRLLLISLGLALAALPARAQLDPRLQVSKTDFLDIYQAGNSTPLKPEIGTVFDFSGSMNRLMFAAAYPNQAGDDDRIDTQSRYLDVMVQITKVSGVYKLSGLMLNNTASTTVTAVGTNYTWMISGVNCSFKGLGLVRPDGKYVTAADAAAAALATTSVNDPTGVGAYILNRANGAADARNWVRAASHARFACTSGTITRVIDLPLNWAILPNGTNAPLPTSYPINPLPRITTTDPKTNLVYDLDTTYLGSPSGNSMLGTAGSTNADGGYSTARIGNSSYNVMLYRSRYLQWLYFGVDASGKYAIPDIYGSTSGSSTSTTAYPTDPSGSLPPFKNGIPNVNRIQAVKIAAIRTWLSYQDRVFWAFRILGYGFNGSTTATADTDSPTTIPIPGGSITSNSNSNTYPNGYLDDGSWYLLNGDTDNGVKAISKCVATTGTPLTQTTAQEMMQFQDVNSPFQRVETLYDPTGVKDNSNAIMDCSKHFFILFTDGVPNESPSPVEIYPDSFPYISSASAGNAKVILDPTQLDPPNTFWNTVSMAGAAAHLSDPKNGGMALPSSAYPGYGSPSQFVPFSILSRTNLNGGGSITFTNPHPIQTMTVGINLGENWPSGTPNPINPSINPPYPIATDVTAPKFRLLAAATVGDPAKASWDIATAQPYPTDGTTPGPDNVFYFDGRSPDAIIKGLGLAFNNAVNLSNQGTAAAPTIPPVGLALSNQVYLGNFTVPKTGGPVWSGDLFMYSTYSTATNTYLIDNTGTAITQPNATNAQWAASNIFTTGGKQWSQRNIWTRIPANSSLLSPGLIRFQDQTQSSTNYTTLKPFVGPITLTDTQRNALMDFVMGADLGTTGPAYKNRADIMGDIIDSAPTTLEYNWNEYKSAVLSVSSILSSAAAGIPATSTPRFRLVFVGDNQGLLHAFGELSWSTPVLIQDPSFPTDPTKKITIPVTHGAVDELWAFLPTDFLANLNYLQVSTNFHRFMVDGSPYAYLLDLPASNAISGNGVVDNSPVQERAMVIFGLRKGGRSYYALDVSDPTTPKLGPTQSAAGWAIRADEATLIPTSAMGGSVSLATAQKVVGNMGFSSSQPFIGRVLYDGGAPAQSIRDAVFLGGGLSTPDVDAQFPDSGGKPTPLGRSAMAVDVNTGQYLMLWDLTNASSLSSSTAIPGPVAAGVVPVSLNLSSGLVSRAYFTDYGGNLWAVGSTQPGTGLFSGFRNDTNLLDHWTTDGNKINSGVTAPVRLVYTQGPNNGIFSTLPAPFLMGAFPSVRTSDPKVAPFALGIAINTGDRNNPQDRAYTSTNIEPTQHRLTVLFDRQDSRDLGLDATGIQTSQLSDFTLQANPSAPVITEGDPTFYLNNGYGYYLNYPPALKPNGTASGFVTKAINDPAVVAGTLFFSYFTPQAFSNPCAPGNGQTTSSRIQDVIHPYFPGFSAPPVSQSLFNSGVVATFSGVATNYSPQGTSSVTQGGMMPIPGTNTTGLAIIVLATHRGQRFPRPRTWRVVR